MSSPAEALTSHTPEHVKKNIEATAGPMDKPPAAHPREILRFVKEQFRQRLPINPRILQQDLEALGEPNLLSLRQPTQHPSSISGLARLVNVFRRTARFPGR